jgi:cytochrome c oxidase cbb3-type subunit 3
MPTKVEKDAVTGTDTTGHEWDGIRELNTPLPRWWLYTFVATIAFAAGYAVLYPSVPWFAGYFHGTLGYTNRDALRQSLVEAQQGQAALRERIAAASVEDIRNDPALFAFAQVGGRAAFAEICAPCHRTGGVGAKGFPNLTDDDWLWGGKITDIEQTIMHGVRNADPESRQSQMPRFGADGLLTTAQISDVADYVMSLSHTAKATPAALARGEKVFAENCAACHGETGIGNREMGAPNLADAIWLYGGDKASIAQTITYARNSSMPAWGERLDPATIKMLTVYVHSLGGGE